MACTHAVLAMEGQQALCSPHSNCCRISPALSKELRAAEPVHTHQGALHKDQTSHAALKVQPSSMSGMGSTIESAV